MNRVTTLIGRYFLAKYRQRAAQSGVQAAALQLRKQGVDVRVAVALLATRGGTQ
jgi:hypothetical protein